MCKGVCFCSFMWIYSKLSRRFIIKVYWFDGFRFFGIMIWICIVCFFSLCYFLFLGFLLEESLWLVVEFFRFFVFCVWFLRGMCCFWGRSWFVVGYNILDIFSVLYFCSFYWMVWECVDGMLMCCCGVDLCNCK